jgi:hypothetical protein
MNTGTRLFGSLAIVFLLAMSMSAAEAEPWRQGPYARERNRQSDFQPRRPDDRRESYRQRNDERGMQRQHRLSPEERSQLRRDIRDAGKEIYPARRR